MCLLDSGRACPLPVYDENRHAKMAQRRALRKGDGASCAGPGRIVRTPGFALQ